MSHIQDKVENKGTAGNHSFLFFLLTFLLSTPFYILNALAFLNLFGSPEMGALYIALFTLAPAASALILTFRRLGSHGLKALLKRILDFRRITNARWYIVILLLPPLIFLLALVCIVVLDMPVPPALVPLLALPVALLFFVILAAGEEVGWMGYAFESMQARGSALRAALVLGAIWALWHLPFFVFMMPDPVVLSAQLLTLIAFRVLMVWVFINSGKSVFAVILFHAVDNTALVTFPEIKAIIPWGAVFYCALTILAAILVTLLWGPKTLARYRFAGSRRLQE